MQKIFIFIFVAGLVLYTASAILVKIDENRRFKKAKKFNDDKIIDRYMEENRKFSKNCKPSQIVSDFHDNRIAVVVCHPHFGAVVYHQRDFLKRRKNEV